MNISTEIVDFDLASPPPSIAVGSGKPMLRAIIRLRGVPLGSVWVPRSIGRDKGWHAAILQAVVDCHGPAVALESVRQHLGADIEVPWTPESLLGASLQTGSSEEPGVSIVICSRSENVTPIKDCLAAIANGSRQPLEIIIVAAAAVRPQGFEALLATHPQVRWISTPDVNCAKARNLAIQIARGEVVAFVEVSSRVDTGWVASLERAFACNPEVSLVTGPVLPLAQDTETQILFEQNYSLDRSCQRYWLQLDRARAVPWPLLGTRRFGSGANMAFRRSLVTEIGTFDVALDHPGTTEAGADLEFIGRALLAGKVLLYEPAASVKHCPPATLAELKAYARREATGFYSYLIIGWQRYPQLRRQFGTLGVWSLARLGLALARATAEQRQLIFSELAGMQRSWKGGERFRAEGKNADLLPPPEKTAQLPLGPAVPPRVAAVRAIEIDQRPLPIIRDVGAYRSVRAYILVSGTPIGRVEIENNGLPVGSCRLQQAIAEELADPLLAAAGAGGTDALEAALSAYLQPPKAEAPKDAPLVQLPDSVPVSIVITTCDRPADLDRCLAQLWAQQTARSVEVIVADNRPASELTPPVVARYPGTKLVREARPGASYGRNAAIAASTGEIVVTVDDDVRVPTDWLEKLLAPLANPKVMAVTGNVLPEELETPAQMLFEKLKGGLSQGFQTRTADGDWLAGFDYLPPVWDLGVSANAAFRANIFADPRIGLMDEALGAGTPSAGGEECYLIYKLLRAGHTLVYAPQAFVWHRHRRELDALYRQNLSHMKGGIGFMIRAWLGEGDRRAFNHLWREMPRYLWKRVWGRLRGSHDDPWWFIKSEIWGYLAGFWSFWRSCQRVRQQGQSAPYVPPAQRHSDEQLTATESAARQPLVPGGSQP